MKKKQFCQKNKYIETQNRLEWKGLDPQYLTDNDLWDSSWLMKKYPEKFQKDLFS